MLYDELKSTVLDMYHLQGMKTLEIANKLDADYEIVLEIIEKDYLANDDPTWWTPAMNQ